MKRLKHLLVISHDMGRIFEILGVATLIPVIVLIYSQEWDMILALLSAPFVFIASGSLLARIPRSEHDSPRLSVALVAVAITWFIIALISSLPYIIALHMPITDSVFEAMSGWTGTGLSLLPDLENTPVSILFWRTYTQWMGGIGIIAFGITMQKRSRMTQFKLFRSEGRGESLMPNVIETAKSLWVIYLVLTLMFTLLLLLSGISYWDSLNLVMTAIATGGFTLYSGGISAYNNIILEMLLIPVMFCGCIPFRIYYLMSRGQLNAFFKDQFVHAIAFVMVIGSIIVTTDLYLFCDLSLTEAIRQGVFCVVSAGSNTGLQNSDISTWVTGPVVILIMIMMMSGASGSTAGGIKINRFVLAIEGLRWWFKRFFVSSKVRDGFKSAGKRYPHKISELELSHNMLTIILYLAVLTIGSLIAFHIDIPNFGIHQIVFDLVSAMSNVGLSVGYISPESPVTVKWIFTVLMWVGRLEILPVMILAMSLIKGFDQPYRR